MAHWQWLNSTPRWKVYSKNIIWPVLAEPRHLFVWRVRIFFTVRTYCNLCSIEMDKPDKKCTDLLEVTADALRKAGEAALMLMVVQRDYLELSVKQAIKK